jgi:predicted signal transduction protein with EAL and GGDEF domain
MRTLIRIYESLAEPYLIGGNEHHIGISMGVTMCPSDSEDIDTLMRHADQAILA